MIDVTTAYGLDFHFPARDSTVGRSLRDYGEFARPEVDLLSIYLEQTDGDLLDVGANIGAISLPLAHRFRNRHIHAFEAHKGVCSILCANVVANKLNNVTVTHAAVGAEESIVQFPTPSLSENINFGAIGFDQAENATTVPVLMTTLNRYVSHNVSVVKIDVEGHEPQVLKGSDILLRGHGAVFLIEASSNNETSSRETLRVMLQAGYRLFWTFAPFITPKAAKMAPTSSGRGDFNVLCLPQGAPVLIDAPEVLSAEASWERDIGRHTYLRAYGY